MIIHSIPSGPLLTNTYIVVCTKTANAAIVDPSPDSFKKIEDFLTKKHLTPRMVLLTHSHWDHIADVLPCKNHYSIPVYLHEKDRPNLENPGSDLIPYWIPIAGVIPDGTLSENQKVEIGELHFVIIETPGHTPGGICFYSKDQKTLISGDTLFKGSMGNVSFANSSPEQMWASLKKLSKLPAETAVFPGHGPSTTIGSEAWLSDAKNVFGKARRQ